MKERVKECSNWLLLKRSVHLNSEVGCAFLSKFVLIIRVLIEVSSVEAHQLSVSQVSFTAASVKAFVFGNLYVAKSV